MNHKVWGLGLAALALCAYSAIAWVKSTPQGPATEQQEDMPADTYVRLKDSTLIRTVEAGASTPETILETYGRIIPNAAALHDINAYISGEIKQVFIRRGMMVQKGDPIAAIYSPEFILTQKAYLALLANEEKLAMLQEEGRLPDYLRDARANLEWWGMSAQAIDRLVEQRTLVQDLIVPAPADGVITEVFVEPGQLINAGDKAMTQFVVIGKAIARLAVADASLWVEGYVFPDRLSLLEMGEVEVELVLGQGETLRQEIMEVLPTVDEKTQLGRFIVDLGAARADLALGQIVPLKLHLEQRAGVWLPRQALLAQGLEPAVYVQREAGTYERRRVTVLEVAEDWARVEEVEVGETVVAEGKMVLEGTYRMAAAGVSSHLGKIIITRWGGWDVR